MATLTIPEAVMTAKEGLTVLINTLRDEAIGKLEQEKFVEAKALIEKLEKVQMYRRVITWQ